MSVLNQIRKRRGSRREASMLPYLIVLPILVFEGFLIVYPIGQGILSSFTSTQLAGGPTRWVGLANYERMLGDSNFYRVMRNTLIYVGAYVAITVSVGLASALVLNKGYRGRTLARALMTIPWAFPEVPTVLVFMWMLNPVFGVMNVFARLLPGVEKNLMWLLDPTLAMISVILMAAWKGFPFYALIILSALQSVDQVLYEAVKVDGANRLQAFRYITLPGISPTIFLLALLASIFSFRQFTLIWLLTGGGPFGSTETVVVKIYRTAFQFFDYSYGATIGVAGLILSMTITILFLIIQRRMEAD